MFAECRQYLIDRLKASGMKTPPYTSMKRLSTASESHIAAVLFGKDTFARNGSKTIYQDDRGDRYKRRKVFDRELSFNVIIGDYEEDKVESTLEVFLRTLDAGIYVDGNFVPIEIEDAEWVEKDDSILRAKIAVNVKVTFNGGVYKDNGFAKVNAADVQIEKENLNGN
jgi:hypothetical protein|nr:MAG TPA: hypothetical protein [Caudoviricetes sp.]